MRGPGEEVGFMDRPRSHPRTASDVPWRPPFEYRCTAGPHVIGADVELRAACPAYVLGVPCTGTLFRFGRGSRT